MKSAERNDTEARSNLAPLLWIAPVVVLLDQVTKLLVTQSMTLGESVPVIPGLLHFTLVHNNGMAFGLLQSTNIPFKTILVTLLALAALVAVTYYAMRSPASEGLTRFGLALIIGGALGNIIDRMRLGYVVDFVDAFYRGAHWPAFNLADSAICVGVGLLILDSFWHRETKTDEREVGAPAPAEKT